MVVFRVDGNEQIGIGHLMRCLTIAGDLRDNQEQCVFIVSDDNAVDFIKNRNFQVVVLDSDYRRYSCSLEKLTAILKELSASTIITDSYNVDELYFESLYPLLKSVYIDDMMDHPYQVHKIINYNIYANQEEYVSLYDNSNYDLPELLLGPDYFPLRQEFKGKKHIHNTDTKKVLFFTGGSDSLHIAYGFLKYIVDLNLKQPSFTFVLGRFNADKELILNTSKETSNIEVLIDAADLSEAMLECDLAVSAAGTTLYELYNMRVPAITYTFADNQLKGAIKFDELKIMKYLGDYRTEKDLFRKIIDCICKHDFYIYC